MRVYISNYRDHWISPYTVLEKVFFWREIDYDEPIIEKLSDILTPFSIALQKFLDFVHPRITYVKIDYWDTWSMDHTLGQIALPMLKQLQKTKQGAPFVDDEDVPEELKSTSAPAKENEWDTDDNHFKRWDWILDEMIFAFECKTSDKDWSEQFWSGEMDHQLKKLENDTYQVVKGSNHTAKYDEEAAEKFHARIKNGLRLFGKYYEGLWD